MPGSHYTYRREVEMRKTGPVTVFSGLDRYPLPDAPSHLDYIDEELLLHGFSIIPKILSGTICQELREEIDRIAKLETLRVWVG